MTQEEKQLLFTDICARLPYGIKAQFKIEELSSCGVDIEIIGILNGIPLFGSGKVTRSHIEYFKPYLRPMLSMTEEEYNSMSWEGCNHVINYSVKHGFQFVEITSFTIEIFNWLNVHHFDYRGLIPIGLALEAPEGMYQN